MSCSSLLFPAGVLTLALATAPGLASSGAAQGRSAEDSSAIESYLLTMPMLRRVLPAMHELGTVRCEERRFRDPHSLSLAEITRKLEACSPVVTTLRQAGVQPRDAALLYAALLHVSRELGRRSGRATALPPGVGRDNALLLEQHDPEIRKLTRTGGRS